MHSALKTPQADKSQCRGSLVYVTSNTSYSVLTYERDHMQRGPCGQISGFSAPTGLYVDANGNLWVSDIVTRQIFEYEQGAFSPKLTLSDANGTPQDIAVDTVRNVVYVAEYKNTVDGHVVVEVYENGSTTPTRTLSDPSARNGRGVAIDNQGNVYAAFTDVNNKAQVEVWSQGKGNPTNLGLELIGPGAMVTTQSGALAMCDTYHYRCGEFQPGSKQMSNFFGHHGRGHTGLGPDKRDWIMPQGLALSQDEQRAYVTSVDITVWAFPGPSHHPLNEIKVPNGGHDGIAVYPASPPGNPYY
jgi:hypothetical protein